jgi:hypothetical protein
MLDTAGLVPVASMAGVVLAAVLADSIQIVFGD